MDPNGTHVADVFSFLHLFGIVLLLGIGGAFYGLVSRFLLLRFGKLGGLVIISCIPAFLPYADSFTAYLTRMRNIGIAVAVVCVVFVGKEIRSRSRTLEHDGMAAQNLDRQADSRP